MRLARIETADGRRHLARIEGDAAVPVLTEPGWAGADALRIALGDGIDVAGSAPVADPVPLAAATLLSPVAAPQKILGIGLNYADHARETGAALPTSPVVFAKAPSSIVGPGAPIVVPAAWSIHVDYEAELAVVIGRRASAVDEAAALAHVLGYTACNDVTARDAQARDGQWVRAKSFDSFCPLGPWIVTADEIRDPQGLAIACRVNGRTLQDSSTEEMVFGVARLVSYVSAVITLEPGDVIATGTPAGIGFARRPPVRLEPGDEVEVEIEAIGTLRNPVAGRDG